MEEKQIVTETENQDQSVKQSRIQRGKRQRERELAQLTKRKSNNEEKRNNRWKEKWAELDTDSVESNELDGEFERLRETLLDERDRNGLGSALAPQRNSKRNEMLIFKRGKVIGPTWAWAVIGHCIMHVTQ